MVRVREVRVAAAVGQLARELIRLGRYPLLVVDQVDHICRNATSSRYLLS